MKFSLSKKLFTGFALLSLLTIITGLMTFAIIEKMAASQRDIELLHEFELTVHALEDATTTQNKISEISSDSYDKFLANLDKAGKLAEKILRSSACLSSNGELPLDGIESCQTVMLEAIDSYPQTAVDYYEKTLFTINIGEKNRYIFMKMIEAAGQLPQKPQRNQANTIINQLEVLKHKFEEDNNFDSIEEMGNKLKRLQDLDPGQNLVKLAQIFLDNNEQTYLNRQDILTSQNRLIESTNRFKKTSRSIYQNIIEEGLNNQNKIRTVIVFSSLCSVVMTLLFWLLTSHRLSRFLHNQKNAISSIKSGDYDYTVTPDTNDELGELCAFTKKMATTIREEISGREYSQQESKELQLQLMHAQRHESIGMLAGGIAHDFNNILTGITGYTDLALARLEDDHPVKKYLETISQSAQQAAEMTRKLLAFHRKQEAGKQIMAINTMLTNLYKILDRMIGEDIILELETAPDLPNVMADPAQIEQVLMNMAVNGKDAMPTGGKLTIKTSSVTINKSAANHLEGVDPGIFIRISIADNGDGMTEKVKKSIFDPLFTTKDTDRGTGLGLATVIRIIKRHNGYISLDSTLGQGTVFNLFLPGIDAEFVSDDERALAGPGVAKGHETILLVDDNDTARDFVCETLEYCGYKLLTASNGSEAVKVMHQTDYPIDLLLTDVIMPGMSGPELAEITKKIHPETKIVFMSGYDDLPADHALRTMNPEGNFLKKPMSIDTLSRKVRETLDR